MSKARNRRQPRHPKARVTGGGARGVPQATAGQRIAELLGHDGAGESEAAWRRWAPHTLPPLPAGEELLATAGAAVTRLLPPVAASSRSVAGCYAMGYGMLGMASQGDAPETPRWLLDDEIPVDPLDVLFYGACWPHRFRDPVEFGHGRDTWLHILAGTRHGGEVARLVAAGLAVSDELELPLDDGRLWLALALRVEQAGIGRAPLAARLMPVKALAGIRAVYGPPADTAVPPPPADAAERLRRFVALMGTGLEQDGSARDALRVGLAVLAAGLLGGAVTLDDLTVASAPMYDLDLDPDAADDDPGHGQPWSARESAAAAARLDLAFEALDHPEGVIAADPEAAVKLLEEVPAVFLVPALRVGVADSGAVGRAVREAASWALGLLPPSPLAALADVVLAASATGTLSSADLLVRVLSLPVAEAAIPAADREFRGRTGVAFARLALEAGAWEVRVSEDHTIRSIDPATATMLGGQRRTFEEKFGRPPGPGEHVFFDPAAATPQPLEMERLAAFQRQMFEEIGLDELTIRASEISELSPPLTGRYPDRARQRDWEHGVAAAAAELGADTGADTEVAEVIAADIRRLRWAMLTSHIAQSADEPEHGAGLVRALRALVATVGDTGAVPGDAPGDIGTRAYAEALAREAPGVVDARRAQASTARARELARAWGDAALVADVDRLAAAWPAPTSPVGWPDVPAALCVVAGSLLTR